MHFFLKRLKGELVRFEIKLIDSYCFDLLTSVRNHIPSLYHLCNTYSQNEQNRQSRKPFNRANIIVPQLLYIPQSPVTNSLN